ncbi:MAG: BatA domain-containing protein [Lutibacter sp.]|nr:BatA domain-containing protein [Lutibacter sp.]
MQFKHPEILYALLLLIIPIIVHLFQLQRFVKVPFTNVAFLKNVERQTRKSAKLKKWLVLISRLLALSCIILAFSQPYFSKSSTQQQVNVTIYLDNSNSMQAKGEKGELLKSAAQKIIENNNLQNSAFTLITNDENLKNLDAIGLKNELISLQYSPNKLDLNTVLLKAKSNYSTETNTLNKIILISDFQNINFENKIDFTIVNSSIFLLVLSPKEVPNIFLDSVAVEHKSTTEITLKALVKSSKIISETIPVSLFQDETLMGKTTAKFANSNRQSVEFTLTNADNFNGKISLVDDGMQFDNDFYFSISAPEKINVLSIGNQAEFLPKIYTEKEFNFTTAPLSNLNYNTIQNQQLIILNELAEIPAELQRSLIEFLENGGNLVVIPSQNIKTDSYNRLLNVFKAGKINGKIENEHQITAINYGHPLIDDVFEKKVTNFQYPKTALHYQNNSRNSSAILKFDNNSAFISSTKIGNGTFYWVAAPLNKNVSDFMQSPLVVPIFYNFSKTGLKNSRLYYTIAPENNIEIKASIGKDDVLKISNETGAFIPLQKVFQNKVDLILSDVTLQSGFYKVSSGNNVLKTFALNYNREESDANYADLKSLAGNAENVTVSTSIDDLFDEIENQHKINWLFKWFLAFSVLFLFIEMLLLKYFKI